MAALHATNAIVNGIHDLQIAIHEAKGALPEQEVEGLVGRLEALTQEVLALSAAVHTTTVRPSPSCAPSPHEPALIPRSGAPQAAWRVSRAQAPPIVIIPVPADPLPLHPERRVGGRLQQPAPPPPSPLPSLPPLPKIHPPPDQR